MRRLGQGDFRVGRGFEKPPGGEGGNQAGAVEDGAEGRFHFGFGLFR